MFIFILQGIWLYISELAGKDLDLGIVLKFLWFYSPRIVTLVLPLSILVTSLMVFGGFAERYEFAAMKSTGISLQRAMRSLSVFIVLLGITAFFFSNNVIPYSEYKWQNLRRNIQQFKPSIAIAEGQFNQIGEDFNIKVAEKSGERGEFLKEVIIHKKNMKRPSSNLIVIIAEDGELASIEGSNTLSLILNNGHYYEEMVEKDYKKQQREPFIKTYFEQYTINIDLTALNKKDVEQENNISNQNMFNIGELSTSIDSLSDAYTKDIKLFSDNMYYRTGSGKFVDKKTATVVLNDTINSVLDIYPAHQRADIIAMAVNNANGTIQAAMAKKKDAKRKVRRLNKYEIALHEKIVLGIACIILFFIGAPLGAIIRKGGMGLPMVVAVVLFLTYHFIGIFAKNSAEDGSIHPFIGTWISTLIMLPLSIWLTYRATTDQGIVDFDQFGQRIKRLFKKRTK
jgi:lipopolysaccharide export system permease protein